MRNLAVNRMSREPRLGLGRIIEQTAQGFYVSTEYGTVMAFRAAGCLLEPETGDRVLIAWVDDGETYVLNVLTRQNPENNTLAMPGDLSIQAGGTMHLTAGAVEMNGQESVRVRTSQIELSALNGSAKLGALRFIAGTVSGNIGRMKTVAKSLETVADRVIDRLGRRHTRVEEVEDAQVGRVRLLVKDLFSMRSRSTSIISKDKVELDADQILLG